MNRIFSSTLRSSVLLALLLAACGDDEFQGPSLVRTPDGRMDIRGTDWIHLSKTYHEFGRIWHGDRTSHVFRVLNKATQSIRLIGIRSACTCAYVELGIVGANGAKVAREIHQPPIHRDGAPMITWIEPGEVLEAKVVVDTRTLPAKDHKEIGETILYFQPGEAGEVHFAYDIRVHARVRIDPVPVIALESISKYQRRPVLFELSPGKLTATEKLPPFEITKIEGLDETIVLEKLPPAVPGGHRFMAEIGPVPQVGPYERVLSFHTSYTVEGNEAAGTQDRPYIAHVRIAGKIEPALRLTPSPRLDFGRFAFEDAARSYLAVDYLRPNVDPELELGVLEVQGPDGEDLAAHFEPKLRKEADGSWEVALEYDGGLGDSEVRHFRGRLLLRSNDPDHETTWIPVTGFRREKQR